MKDGDNENQLMAENLEFESELRDWLSNSRKVVVAGVGNPLRKDDFVGVKIVRDLQEKVSPSVYLIEGETVPESFIFPISKFKPTHIIIIDAALLDLNPGSPKLVEPSQLAAQSAISTHTLPLQVFCEYLEKATRAKIILIAIQPGDTRFGEGLTLPVMKTANRLTVLLANILP